jgi:hypothetical protein
MLGTALDPQKHHVPVASAWLDNQSLEALYYGGGYAKKIVQAPVKASFRRGFSLTAPADLDPEAAQQQREMLSSRIWDLEVQRKLQEAIIWGRLYGRSGLLLGADDGRSSMRQPLRPERIRGLDWVEVLEADDFSVLETQDDPRNQGYGEPDVWIVHRASGRGETQEVHSSRIILTGGEITSRRKREEEGWRDLSVLQGVYDQLQRYDQAIAGIGRMLLDSSQAVLGIDGLARMLASEGTEVFTSRMRILELARSIRVMPIDSSSESFDYVERSFTGVADSVDRIINDVAGAADMPQTVLFGRAPAGLNATGESDIRAWYDSVAADRDTLYTPLLERIVYYAAIAAGLDKPDRWGIEWPSLWQMSPTEKSEHQKSVAKTDKIYVDMGAVTEDEVAMTRFGGNEWSDGPIQIDFEMRERLRAMDIERAAEQMTDPDEPGDEDSEPQDGEEEQDERGDAERRDPDVAEAPPASKRGEQIAQSVTLPASWTRAAAASWLRERGHRSETLERPNSSTRWRARQFNPEHFVEGTFATEEVERGVQIVTAVVEGGDDA